MKSAFSPTFTTLAALLFLATTTRADITPAPLFQNHAVLQAGQPLPVWGRADAGEKVSVSFAGQTRSTTTAADGSWHVMLAPLATNDKPAELKFTGKNTLVLRDILVGEVWLCSGQSNMNFKLSLAANAEAEIAAANYPLIRHFSLRSKLSNTPETTLDGCWYVCTPANAGNFTAVGYFFARELHQKLGVPVGIIHSSWGGTNIEPWMSPESTAKNPDLTFVAEDWQKELADIPAIKAKYDAAEAAEEQKAAAAKARGETYKKAWHRPPPKADGSPHEDKPSAIYNAMIAPFEPAALAGVIWYQGENNVGRAAKYHKLFPALITGWRAAFDRPDLPFYWVQLPNFGGFGTDQIAALREAQDSALALPHTGEAVTIDIGEKGNIHPKDKQDVGHRLALIALRDTYKQKVVATGPRFAKARFSGGSATIAFTDFGSGLEMKGPALLGFEVAGADKKFTPAEARIEGTTVVVKAPAVPSPVAVRYAWHNAPAATLYNQEGLPAAPFRTDTW